VGASVQDPAVLNQSRGDWNVLLCREAGIKKKQWIQFIASADEAAREDVTFVAVTTARKQSRA
jgi:hypothetical protein